MMKKMHDIMSLWLLKKRMDEIDKDNDDSEL